jgi:hypothetical protein
MGSSLCSFLRPLVTSSLLGPNVALIFQFSNTLNLSPSLNMRDHISHPYRTTDLDILIGSRQEDERF